MVKNPKNPENPETPENLGTPEDSGTPEGIKKSTELVMRQTGQILDLKPEEKSQIQAMKNEIIEMFTSSDTEALLTFGGESGLGDISSRINGMKSAKEVGETGQQLVALVGDLKKNQLIPTGYENLNVLEKIIKKLKKGGEVMTVDEGINSITQAISNSKDMLDEAIPIYDELFEENADKYRQVQLELMAGGEALNAMTKYLQEQIAKFEEDGIVDDFEKTEIQRIKSSIEIFQKTLRNLEDQGALAALNAVQINIMRDAVTSTKQQFLSLETFGIPALKMQLGLTTTGAQIESLLDAGRQMGDLVQKALEQGADQTKRVAIKVKTESSKPIIDQKTLNYMVNTLSATYKEIQQIDQKSKAALQRGNTQLEKGLAKLGEQQTAPLQLGTGEKE